MINQCLKESYPAHVRELFSNMIIALFQEKNNLGDSILVPVKPFFNHDIIISISIFLIFKFQLLF